jgi:hypothetical protein
MLVVPVTVLIILVLNLRQHSIRSENADRRSSGGYETHRRLMLGWYRHILCSRTPGLPSFVRSLQREVSEGSRHDS